MMKRTFIRFTLFFCGVAALFVFVMAFYSKGPMAPETWLVATAALAVLASLSSAWSAQITVAMQEDQLRPYVVIYLETTARYQLMQVRMKNFGRSSAFEISDHWDCQLYNHRGQPISFATGGKPVAVLHPDQWLTRSIDTQANFYEKYTGDVYEGLIRFTDAAGRRYEGSFSLDPSAFKGNLSYGEEELRTHYEVQKIPDKLDRLAQELNRLTAVIDKGAKGGNNDVT